MIHKASILEASIIFARLKFLEECYSKKASVGKDIKVRLCFPGITSAKMNKRTKICLAKVSHEISLIETDKEGRYEKVV